MHGRRSSLRGSQEDSAIVHQPASLRRERSITGSTSGGSPIAHPPSHRSSPACSSAQPSGNQARIDLGVARYPSANPSTGRARVASMPAPHPAVIINSVRKEAVFAPSPLSRVVARVPPPTDLDNESYRLAKACGQDALSASASSPAGWAFLGSEDPASLSQQPLTTSQSVSSLGAALNTLATSGQHLSTQPPPRFPHPSVYDVLGVFVKELRRQHLSLHDWIDPDALYTEVRDKPTEEIRSNPGEDARVFGVAVRELHELALNTITHGKFRYEIPTVVARCVDQLYRTGIYQFELFRAIPNMQHLDALMNHFDHPGQHGSPPAWSLADEAMPTTCALLRRYIRQLPEPLLPRCLFNALWVWCVLPTSDIQDRPPARQSSSGSRGRDTYRAASSPQRETGDAPRLDQIDPRARRSRSGSGSRRLSLSVRHPLASATGVVDETPHLALAQYILLMMNPRCFALLSYLLAFFSQLPLSPSNGVTYEDISRIFASSLLGGPGHRSEPVDEDSELFGDRSDPHYVARKVMGWLLDRWNILQDTFDNMSLSYGFAGVEEEASTPGVAGNQRQSLFRSDAESDNSESTVTRPTRRASILRNGNGPRQRRSASDGAQRTSRRVSFSSSVDEHERQRERAASTSSSESPSVLREQLQAAVCNRTDAQKIVHEISSILGKYAS